jgi:hypothetical protein
MCLDCGGAQSEAILFPLALVWTTKSGDENTTMKWHASESDELLATWRYVSALKNGSRLDTREREGSGALLQGKK